MRPLDVGSVGPILLVMNDINTVRLVSGHNVASFTTVRGTGACTAVVGRAVQTLTLAAGRERIAALLSDGWTVAQDEGLLVGC